MPATNSRIPRKKDAVSTGLRLYPRAHGRGRTVLRPFPQAAPSVRRRSWDVRTGPRADWQARACPRHRAGSAAAFPPDGRPADSPPRPQETTGPANGSARRCRASSAGLRGRDNWKPFRTGPHADYCRPRRADRTSSPRARGRAQKTDCVPQPAAAGSATRAGPNTAPRGHRRARRPHPAPVRPYPRREPSRKQAANRKARAEDGQTRNSRRGCAGFPDANS